MSTDRLSNAPEVSVIIPHYQEVNALAACLASLAAQSLPAHMFEVIVIDNARPSDLAPLKEAYPQFNFLFEAQKGAAHARNKGLAAACGKAVAFLDADCIAHRDWLRTGLGALQYSDLVGGDIIVTAQSGATMTAVEAFECVFAFHQRNYINRKHFSVTANLFATREAADAIGPFVHGVSEDVDWCLRARALGFRLSFNDTSIISHPARRTWTDLTDKWGRLITERWNGFGGCRWTGQLRWAGLAVATALSAAPHLGAVLFSRRITGAENKIAAAAVLVKIRFWRAQRMFAQLRPLRQRSLGA